MSWISLLAKRRSRSTSHELSTLPRSGRIACVSLSRPILALPPAESPSTRKTSFSFRSRLSQSVSLPGSTATPEPLRFSTFCDCALARLRLADHQVGELLAQVHMLVEPQLQRRLDVGRHQPQRVAAVQPLLDLALELRVQHLGRQHEAGAREHVLGHQLHALGRQRMQFDEPLDGAEQAVLQPGLVRAADQRGDQVDIALAQRGAILGEGHAPGRALAFGEVLGLVAGGVLLAFEQRDQRLGHQALVQVVAQTALVEPSLRLVATSPAST